MIQKEKQQEGHGSKPRFYLRYTRQAGGLARLFLFFAISLLPFIAQAQSLAFTDAQKIAYTLVCQYRLAEADSAISRLSISPEKIYLLNLRDFLSLSVSERLADYESYLASVPERETQLATLLEIGAIRNFYLADFRLQQALLSIRFGNNFTGLYKLHQAKSMADVVNSSSDNFAPILKTKGIINVVLGMAPENYKWWLAMAGLEGNVEEGIVELQKLEQSNSPLSAEATLVLGFIYTYPLPDQRLAASYFSKYNDALAENRLAKFMLAVCHSRAHQADSALTVLNTAEPDDWASLPQALYLMGDLMLQKGNTKLAREHYSSFLEKHPGKSFKKDACTKIAVSYLLDNNREMFLNWLEVARKEGETSTEPDKNARVLLEELQEYPLSLLRSRLLSDGGYLEAAQAELSSIASVTGLVHRWQSEYCYRQARIFHFQKEFTKALTFYQRADELADGQPWYIGASAALQAGLILWELGRTEEAELYLNRASEYPDHPYKQSVDSQAGRALALLRRK